MADVQITIATETLQAVKNLDKFVRTIDKSATLATKDLKRISKATSSLNQVFTTFAGVTISKLVVGAFSALTRAISSSLSGIAKSTQEIEDIENQFLTLTKSVELTQKVMEDLTEFTATTPFQLPGVAKTAQSLLAFRFGTEELVPILRNLGDVAAGSGSSIREIGLIFGQVRAAGKLTGERLLQLEERAIILGPALAKGLGVAESSIRDLVSKGKVDFETFRKAFESLSAEGGLFFEATIRQSRTLSGVLSTLGDNFSLLGSDIGQTFLPAFKEATIFLIAVIQDIREAFKANRVEIVQFTNDFSVGLVNAISIGINILDVLAKTVGVVFNGITIIISTASIGILASVRGILDGINFLADAIPGVEAPFADATASITATMDSLVKSIEEDFGDLESTFGDVSGLEKASLAVKGFADELEATLNKSVEVTKDSVDKRNKEADKLTDRQQRQLEFEKFLVEEKKGFNKQLIESEIEKNNAILLIQEEQRQLAEEQKFLGEEQFTAEQEELLANLEQGMTREAALRELFRVQQLIAEKKFGEARKRIAESTRKANEQSLKSLFDFEKNTNAGRAANFKSTLSTIATLQSSGNVTLFRIGQAAAVATSIVDGVAAVQKALASAPPPFNFILAGLVGAATAINTAKIAAASPPGGGGLQGGATSIPAGFPNDSFSTNLTSGERVVSGPQNTDLTDFLANAEGQTPLLQAINDKLENLQPQVNVSIGDEEVFDSVDRELERGRRLSAA